MQKADRMGDGKARKTNWTKSPSMGMSAIARMKLNEPAKAVSAAARIVV
jgi:hypothetical protein